MQKATLILSSSAAALMLAGCGAVAWLDRGAVTVSPVAALLDRSAVDQDDMCIWVHPADPALSTVITSDKKADRIVVYDLRGTTIQAIANPKPGNIDVRYGFPLGGRTVDIVAFNQRSDGALILVYAVDPTTRRLSRVDDGTIATEKGYGGGLYHSRKTGAFYFFKTSKAFGSVEQFELRDNGRGRVRGVKVREWRAGCCEGAVADDETGMLYLAGETQGVWEVGAEPTDPTLGKVVIRLGAHGLIGDVEGLAIYYLPGGDGYLIASNQAASNFKVYRRRATLDFIGTFSVRGASRTDGIDVTNVTLGRAFPGGLFACHTNRKPGAANGRPVLLTPWDSIAKALTLKSCVPGERPAAVAPAGASERKDKNHEQP